MKIKSTAIVIGLIVLASCRTCPPPQTSLNVFPSGSAPKVLSRATILATGDILMHGAVKKSAQASGENGAAGFAALFADVGPDIKAADISFANWKPPFPPERRGSPRLLFSTPRRTFSPHSRDLGINVSSVANNHMYDQNEVRLAETLDEVERAHIITWAPAKPKTGRRRRSSWRKTASKSLSWVHRISQQ